jgi:murein DD-endopeptidase MepM/ murein hydrolase activator NlpD
MRTSTLPVPLSHGRPRRPGGGARAPRGALRGVLPAVVLAVVVLVAGAGGSAGQEPGRSPGFVPEWSWPLTPAPAVLRPFEKPPRPWQRGHRGVDLAGVDLAGTAPSVVLSPADGVVSFAGTVVDRGVLSIDHGGGRVSSFEPVTTDLVRGQRVSGGQAVATLDGVGPGPPRGHCGGCLHWGVRVDGEYVDPLSFVTDRRPSVLLPLGDGGRRAGG